MNATPDASVDIRVKGGRDGNARLVFTTSKNVDLWSGAALYRDGHITSERMDVHSLRLLCETAEREDLYALRMGHPDCGKDGQQKSYMVTLRARKDEEIDRLQRDTRLWILNHYGLEDYQGDLVLEESFSAMLQRVLGSVHERAVAACNIELPKCTITAWPR